VTVPTPETCSVTFWMQQLVNMRRPVMMAGPAGTGKTQLVFGMLSKQKPDEVRVRTRVSCDSPPCARLVQPVP
jgi:dynein heavy chain, axonemal